MHKFKAIFIVSLGLLFLWSPVCFAQSQARGTRIGHVPASQTLGKRIADEPHLGAGHLGTGRAHGPLAGELDVHVLVAHVGAVQVRLARFARVLGVGGAGVLVIGETVLVEVRCAPVGPGRCGIAGLAVRARAVLHAVVAVLALVTGAIATAVRTGLGVRTVTVAAVCETVTVFIDAIAAVHLARRRRAAVARTSARAFISLAKAVTADSTNIDRCAVSVVAVHVGVAVIVLTVIAAGFR